MVALAKHFGRLNSADLELCCAAAERRVDLADSLALAIIDARIDGTPVDHEQLWRRVSAEPIPQRTTEPVMWPRF